MAIHQWSFPRDPAQIRNMPRTINAMQTIVNAVLLHAIDATGDRSDRLKQVVTGKEEDGITDRVSVAYDGSIEIQGSDAGQPFVYPGTISNSCDTSGKAYDLLVLACLAVAKVNLRGDISISSDASRGQWQQAATLASDILGDTIPNPLDDV